MTPDELTIFRRAVEGGAFADLRDAWHAEAEEPTPEHSAEDTRVMRELVERASSLFGRPLVVDRELLATLGQAFRSPSSRFNGSMPVYTAVFMLSRFLDERWV